ncbi:hypothetical protein [Massilia phyllostachyos]|uniref:hypothetical protein n=1 Tax=Massilia phyllostachyos TaxID=2898585 RepID=UPI0035317382
MRRSLAGLRQHARRDQGVQALHQEAPVGQAGEHVVEGEAVDRPAALRRSVMSRPTATQWLLRPPSLAKGFNS